MKFVINYTLLLFIPLLICEGQNLNGTIKYDTVNVFTQPFKDATILCQMQKGEKVNIIEFVGKWVKIVAPAKAPAWIYTNFIDAQNKVNINSVEVRSGPGINYRSIGQLLFGTEVTTIKSQDRWSKIKPIPKFVFGWIKFAEAIDLQNNSNNKISPKNSSEEPSSSINLPPKKLDKEFQEIMFISDEEQSEKKLEEHKDFITVTGYLLKVTDNVLADYALAEKHDSKFFPIFYLSGFKNEMQKYVNKKVTVYGIKRFVKGWYRPIIYINSFEIITKEY